MKTNNLHEEAGYCCLLIRAEEENVSQEAVNTLLRYYTDTLGWGMNEHSTTRLNFLTTVQSHKSKH